LLPAIFVLFCVFHGLQLFTAAQWPSWAASWRRHLCHHVAGCL